MKSKEIFEKWGINDLEDGYCGSKGAIRKIADAPWPCRHPEHNFPEMIVLEPGTYEHTCPSCGKKQTVRIPRIFCKGKLL